MILDKIIQINWTFGLNGLTGSGLHSATGRTTSQHSLRWLSHGPKSSTDQIFFNYNLSPSSRVTRIGIQYDLDVTPGRHWSPFITGRSNNKPGGWQLRQRDDQEFRPQNHGAFNYSPSRLAQLILEFCVFGMKPPYLKHSSVSMLGSKPNGPWL